jgi:hypothetical protein
MKLLNWLRITDEQGNLSITNVAVLIVLIKLAIAPAVSLTEVGGLLIALANYSSKKLIKIKQEPVQSVDNERIKTLTAALEEVKSKQSSMALTMGMKPRV